MILRNSSNKPIQIDNYKVLSQLGKGGFGTVYHVKDSSREYALKLLRNSYNIARVQNHFGVLKILNTSELFLKTYQTKKVLDKYLILMEYLPSFNLEKLVKKEIYTEKTACKVMNDMLNSLEFLQEKKLFMAI